MNLSARILTSVGSTEPTTMHELFGAMRDDLPEKGDHEGWAEFFRTIHALQDSDLIEVERDRENRISSLILTDLGAERAREAQRER
jgi:hypothetical protein